MGHLAANGWSGFKQIDIKARISEIKGSLDATDATTHHQHGTDFVFLLRRCHLPSLWALLSLYGREKDTQDAPWALVSLSHTRIGTP